jgi:hypothetical protein
MLRADSSPRWDERPFLDDRVCFSPAVGGLIRANYERRAQLDGLEVYRPRH